MNPTPTLRGSVSVRRFANCPVMTCVDDDGTFDTFFCYNSRDKALIRKIGYRLLENGITPWFDEWELRPGARPFQRCLDDAIRTIPTATVFIGSAGLGTWQHLEI